VQYNELTRVDRLTADWKSGEGCCVCCHAERFG